MRIINMVCAGMVLATGVCADTIWEQDFSNVDDWLVTGGNGRIEASSGTALMTVTNPESFAWFTPELAIKANFVYANVNDYYLNFGVDSCSWNQSYDVCLDQWDASETYLGRAMSIGGDHSQSTGALSFAFSSVLSSISNNCAYVKPNILSRTGPELPEQTVIFDYISIQTVPEPASVALLLAGCGLVFYVRSRRVYK